MRRVASKGKQRMMCIAYHTASEKLTIAAEVTIRQVSPQSNKTLQYDGMEYI
jgi:hypothetical protein